MKANLTFISLGLSGLVIAACGPSPAASNPGEPATAHASEALLSVQVQGAHRLSSVTGLRASEEGPRIQEVLNPGMVGIHVPQDRFCAVLGDALCGNLEACGCSEDKADCYESVAIDCEGRYGMMGPQVQAAEAQDRLIYDGHAAYRFLRDLAAGAQACQTPLDVLGWTRQDMLSFGGIFRGTVSAGEACNLPFAPFRANECKDGACMLDENNQGRCVRTVDLGGACGPEALCFNMNRPVEIRDFYAGTFVGRCEPGLDGESICTMREKAGERCQDDDGCASGRCVNKTCAALALSGESCRGDLDCAQGACAQGRCQVDFLAVGERCDRHAECATDVCNSGLCAEPICR